MARRGARKTRRRRDTRFNILNAVESVVYGSIITEAVFDTSLPGFFLEPESAAGTSITQLLSNPEASFRQAADRLQNPQIMVQAAISGVMAGVLFGVFSKALRKPRNKVNRGLKQLGVPVKL
jgi:membrane associated rhomboid family serine protease